MFNREPIIGEAVPVAPRPDLLGPILAVPQWFILVTPPQKERKARRWLERIGIQPDDIWFPVTREWVPASGARLKYEREVLLAPRYVFARFDRDPDWPRLFAAAPMGCVRGVVSRGEVPYAVPLRVMAQMATMPGRVAELRAAEEAAIEARRPRAGDVARLTQGPLAGYMVDITRVHAGLARFVMADGAPIQGEARVETMEKVG